jgi:hypothetical protein
VNKAFKLVFVATGWPLAAAVIGWIVFDTIYVEHGSVILWIAGVFLGLIAGLIHVLLLVSASRDRQA